jgi:branched-chain amino acid transport system ATP-binding protein
MTRGDRPPLLQIKDLRAGYGNIEVLHSINLQINKTEIVSIIGPNGAGKTTLMAAIMGLIPSSGNIVFPEMPTAQIATEELVSSGIILVPEQRALFTDMTVEDNLTLGGFQRYRNGARDLASTMDDVFQIFPRLKERRRQHAGTLSGGERQMLALGRALMAKPKLLLLDEPSLGLAPRIVRDIFKILVDLRNRDLAILLVEQNARAALQISDYAYVLEMGEVALEGLSEKLFEDKRIVETYLGKSMSHP